jgi:hypothetical protein
MCVTSCLTRCPLHGFQADEQQLCRALHDSSSCMLTNSQRCNTREHSFFFLFFRFLFCSPGVKRRAAISCRGTRRREHSATSTCTERYECSSGFAVSKATARASSAALRSFPRSAPLLGLAGLFSCGCAVAVDALLEGDASGANSAAICVSVRVTLSRCRADVITPAARSCCTIASVMSGRNVA